LLITALVLASNPGAGSWELEKQNASESRNPAMVAHSNNNWRLFEQTKQVNKTSKQPKSNLDHQFTTLHSCMKQQGQLKESDGALYVKFNKAILRWLLCCAVFVQTPEERNFCKGGCVFVNLRHLKHHSIITFPIMSKKSIV